MAFTSEHKQFLGTDTIRADLTGEMRFKGEEESKGQQKEEKRPRRPSQAK
jgi:hypothetical protein